MTRSVILRQVREAVELAEKHDLALLEIPGVAKIVRHGKPPPREELTPDQLVAKERAEARRLETSANQRQAKIDSHLEKFS